jgi:hypothetical protein
LLAVIEAVEAVVVVAPDRLLKFVIMSLVDMGPIGVGVAFNVAVCVEVKVESLKAEIVAEVAVSTEALAATKVLVEVRSTVAIMSNSLSD